MKRNVLPGLAGVLFLICTVAYPNPAKTAGTPGTTILSISPLNLLTGYVGGGIETRLNDELSLYVSPSYYLYSLTLFSRLFPDVDVWSVNASVGINFFFEHSAPFGPYFGIGLVAGYMSASDGSVVIEGPFTGMEIRTGYRIAIAKHVALAPNSAVRFVRALFNTVGLSDEAVRVANAMRSRFGINPGIIF